MCKPLLLKVTLSAWTFYMLLCTTSAAFAFLKDDNKILLERNLVQQNEGIEDQRSIPSVSNFLTDPNNSVFFALRLSIEVNQFLNI